jgi:DNA-directed RNA polymerase subunit M/transcription elongation factor TFIIS
MTACNKCGKLMVPAQDALIGALECIGCGRIIPATGYKHRKGRGSLEAEEKRIRRAARRNKRAE